MNIQTKYSLIYGFFILAQIYCMIKSYIAYKNDKPIGKFVFNFNIALLIPITANLLIIEASNKIIAELGYYMYYIGMTLVMMTLVSYINEYCQGIDNGKYRRKPTIVYILGILGILDIIQILLNPIGGQVFGLKEIIIDEKVNYKPIPEVGLAIHCIIDYAIMTCILLILLIAIIKTSKLYREKFTIIFVALILASLFQAYFIVNSYDIDKSVIAHGLSGMIIYYFSLKYRPLRLLDAMLSNIASDMDDSVFMFDGTTKCVWVNENGCKLLNIDDKKLYNVKDLLVEKFGNITKQGDNWTKDIYLNETKEFFSLEKKSVKTNDKHLDGSFLIVKDATNKRRKIEQDIYNSMHDNLTGLFNMQYLYNYVDKMLKDTTIDSAKYCIIYINVKNFKIINDIFGTTYGDQVLISIGKWLTEHLTIDKCIFGRLIADTFGIFMPIDSFDEHMFTQDLSKFIVKYKNISHQIFIHIGVYKITDKNLDISVMFDRAHLAVASIVDNYKTCVKYYDDNLRNNVLEEQKLTASLAEAIENNEIQPYLQPIVDRTGKVIGAEALARWIHPEQGFMPPMKFIPIFEKNGMIVEVDKHMWESACKILASWKDIHDDLFISINISPKDFYFIDVTEELQRLINKYQIDAIKLRIEITETAMMSDPEERIKIFDKLRTLGFIVEMDDFGSGYSSLNMLKDMPVDVLKIDMKFLSSTKDKSNTIIKNVINLSNDLDMTALTEGVETQQQYNQLINMGCSLFQGYYFAKPMPVNEFEKFLDSNNGGV